VNLAEGLRRTVRWMAQSAKEIPMVPQRVMTFFPIVNTLQVFLGALKAHCVSILLRWQSVRRQGQAGLPVHATHTLSKRPERRVELSSLLNGCFRKTPVLERVLVSLGRARTGRAPVHTTSLLAGHSPRFAGGARAGLRTAEHARQYRFDFFERHIAKRAPCLPLGPGTMLTAVVLDRRQGWRGPREVGHPLRG